nr:helix-turn-helix transcriptional regulator [Clostridium sp. UBA1652]
MRKELNLTKEDIAIRSGIPIKVVSKIESLENNVKLDVFLRYITALGIKINLDKCL